MIGKVVIAPVAREARVLGRGERSKRRAKGALGDVARYGLDGSIRTDVVMRDPNSPSGRPIAVWDVKTGEARLSGPRVQEIRDQLRVGREVPVIELHVKRGISNKALGGGSHSVAVISVQVWDSHLPNNWDPMAIH
jgi:hypothetical protein